jgi:signal-transduction protein with cAMP-binding, CBS, and nucleotidyltransferase domain
MPRKFEEQEIVYEEEDEVPEIYFIMEGTIGVGFRQYSPNKESENIQLFKFFEGDKRAFICDYYVMADKKSEFIYQAAEETKVYALQKNFLQGIFAEYPDVGDKI